MTEYSEGDRVVLPDPQRVNPLGGSPPQPFGPGVVLEVIEHPHGGAPLLRCMLDSGEQRTIGSLFVKREQS